jgi:hypothetical protein
VDDPLTAPLFAVYEHEISGRDLILIVGGVVVMLAFAGALAHGVARPS